MKIKIYNDTGNTDLYLYFDNGGSAIEQKGFVNFKNHTYAQPWADKTKPLTEPFECSLETIRAGTFWFLVTNDTGKQFITDHPNTPMGSGDPNWVGGFFELTSLKSDSQSYFDITNVDQVGLLCGVEFSVGTQTVRCGYKQPAKDFIAGIMSKDYCNLSKDTSNGVESPYKSITGTDGKTYFKLLGPPQSSKAYKTIYDDYIAAITKNQTALTFNSDSTIYAKDPQHSGTQLGSFKFEGTFNTGDDPVKLPAGSGISDPASVILVLTAKDCPTAGNTTSIYFTKDAINGATIMTGTSPNGMYVYPAFEYSDPAKPSNILKGGWAKNVPVNWSATGPNAVFDTTCFMAMIDSVGRDLMTALNMGYIGVKSGQNNFVYGQAETFADAATQAKYENKWNKYITGNSDSYGMAYSDNAHAKVLYHPPKDGTLECHVLAQDDPKTGSFYTPPPPKK